MPVSSTSENALIVIAVASAIQTLILLAFATMLAIGWRRVTTEVDRRLEAVTARLDEAVRDARVAAEAVARVSDEASGLLGDAGGMVRSFTAAVATPRTLLVAGAASAARGLLSRWRRTRSRAA